MKAQVSLKTGSKTMAIAKALMDETKQKLPKVKTEIWANGGKININLEAEDLVSLRAALNSFLGWAHCAQGVVENE